MTQKRVYLSAEEVDSSVRNVFCHVLSVSCGKTCETGYKPVPAMSYKLVPANGTQQGVF